MANWIWNDVQGVYDYVSPRMAHIYGMTPEAFEASEFTLEDKLFMAHPDDVEAADQALRDGDKTREPYQIEYRIIWLNGSIHTIRDSIAPVFDENGKHARSIGCTQDITDFVEVQEKLYEAQLNYRWAAEVGKLGHYVWDEINDVCEYCSDELANFVGMTAEEFMASTQDIEQHMSTVIHPADLQRLRDYTFDSNEKGEDLDIVYGVVHRDGHTKYVHESGRRVFDSDGKMIRTLAILRDVTDEKIAEQALQVALERLDALVQHQNDLICRFAPDGTLNFANQAYANFIGYDETDVVGMSIFDVVPEEEQEGLRNHLGQLGAENTTTTIQNMNTDKDGNDRLFEWKNYAYLDEFGMLTEIQSVGRDITELARVQAELHEAQLNYRWAAEIGKLGHYVKDEINGVCEYCSDELASFFDLSVEEYVERSSRHEGHIVNALHADDQERYRHYLKEADESGSQIDIVVRILRPSGEILYLHEFGRRVHDQEGRMIRTLGIVRDVTDEKTAELALRDARNDAESANRLKSEFLAHMSHELRTPLNAITGFSQIMENQTFGDLGNERYVEYAGDINRSGQHLLKVINDILDLSKIEAEEITLEVATFGVEDAIATCVNMVSGHRGDNKQRINIVLPENPAQLLADERIFNQIVLNLLSNANKFTPEDGVISVSVEYDDDSSTRIKVTDTGHGIAQVDLAKVLEPFGQAKVNSHHSHEGTGLGLPLSQKLMELHGGTLSLESELGVGTAVTLVFPPERTVPTVI